MPDTKKPAAAPPAATPGLPVPPSAGDPLINALVTQRLHDLAAASAAAHPHGYNMSLGDFLTGLHNIGHTLTSPDNPVGRGVVGFGSVLPGQLQQAAQK